MRRRKAASLPWQELAARSENGVEAGDNIRHGREEWRVTRVTLDLRGSTEQQIRSYLEALGGVSQPDGSVAGPGWTARLTVSEHRAFRIVWPRVIVDCEGEPDAVRAVEKGLRLRAMRGGG